LNEIISKRRWDSKTFDTGRNDVKELPIYGTKLQEGLHDIESDGSFVECDTKFQPYSIGVSTDKVIRNRCGEVRISDTGSESKDLAKIKTKNKCGISLKLRGHRTYGPNFDDLKSTYYTTNDGVTLRYYPNHKGINIVLELANPQIASNVYRFTIKEYGCSYTYEKIDGGIKCISSTGKDNIYIRATYAKDAEDNYGPVDIDLDGIEAGHQVIKKTISPVWLGNAVGPVEVDPNITIDDDTGTFFDALIYNGIPNNNYGAFTQNTVLDYGASNKQKVLHWVDLSSIATATITSGYFGFDIFGGTFPKKINSRELLTVWGEGNKAGAPATSGECSWNHSAYTTLWNTAGCNGDGTDRSAAVDSSLTVTALGNDTHFTVTADSLNNMKNGTNEGYLFESDIIELNNNVIWRSNEGTGNKPYLYVEYIEGVISGFPFFFGEGHY